MIVYGEFPYMMYWILVMMQKTVEIEDTEAVNDKAIYKPRLLTEQSMIDYNMRQD